MDPSDLFTTLFRLEICLVEILRAYVGGGRVAVQLDKELSREILGEQGEFIRYQLASYPVTSRRNSDRSSSCGTLSRSLSLVRVKPQYAPQLLIASPEPRLSSLHCNSGTKKLSRTRRTL